MAQVKFIKSAIAGQAEIESKKSTNVGAICFDLTNGQIWLDGVLVGQKSPDAVRCVTDVVLQDGSLVISYSEGNPATIVLPEGMIYTAGKGITLTPSNIDEPTKLDTINVDLEKLTIGDLYGEAIKVTQNTGGLVANQTLGIDMSIEAVLRGILQKENQPGNPVQPAVTLKAPQNKAYEVGTTVTPTYTASLSAGSYTYGPATGIVATSWNVSDGVTTKDTASGTFDPIVVTDSTNYVITATATHDAGTQAVTNLGNVSNPLKQIAAGSKTASSTAITGYRKHFFGTKINQVAAGDIDSAVVRGLSASAAGTNTAQFSMTIADGTRQVILACPKAGHTGGLSVIDVGLSNSEVWDTFTRSEVMVEGANGATAVAYYVWTYNPATALGSNTYKVTFK